MMTRRSGRRRAAAVWVPVPAEPVQGEVEAGVVEIPTGSARFRAGTTVMVRLGADLPAVQCRVRYADRAQAQAVFSAAEFNQLGWSELGGHRQVEIRAQLAPDVARTVFSLRSLRVLAPVVAALIALGPLLIWPAPGNSASQAQITAAEVRATDLANTPGISGDLRRQLDELRSGLRAAVHGNAATLAQRSANARATAANGIAVVILAIVFAAPPFAELVGLRRRRGG